MLIEKREKLMRDIKRIVLLKADGVSDEKIREIYGISRSEWKRLMKGEIGRVIEGGRQEIGRRMETRMVENIERELEVGENRGAMWYLERTRPEVFGNKGRLSVEIEGIESIIRAKEQGLGKDSLESDGDDRKI